MSKGLETHKFVKKWAFLTRTFNPEYILCKDKMEFFLKHMTEDSYAA